jgi:RNA polymerase sigma-70 factor (ECF subfamily)
MFRPVVHGIALAHVGPADADDVTQEVFVRVLQALPTLRDPAAFPGWIAGTARNAALDALRRRTRRPAAEPLPDDLPSPRADAPEPDADQAADAVRRRVLAALARVPDTYRETLYLRFAEGLTGLEIAERTGRSPGALRVHLCRGTALLRQELRRDAR